ncbi:hypothetical protein C8F01DRAFT_1185032, partial [Mycena amicta]
MAQYPRDGAPYYNVNVLQTHSQAHALQPQGPQQYTYGTNPRQTYPQQHPYPTVLQPSYPQPLLPGSSATAKRMGSVNAHRSRATTAAGLSRAQGPRIGLGLQLLGVPTTSIPVVSYYPTPPPEANLISEQESSRQKQRRHKYSSRQNRRPHPSTQRLLPPYRSSPSSSCPGDTTVPQTLHERREMLEKADVWEDSDDEAKQVVDVVPDETHDEELRLEDRPATPTPTPTVPISLSLASSSPPIVHNGRLGRGPFRFRSASPIPGSPILSATIPTPSPPSPPPAPPHRHQHVRASPMSSVVGFSIPAEPAVALIPLPEHYHQRLDPLCSLYYLGNVPPPPTSPTTFKTKIPPSVPVRLTPRGLINTGNMCFANAVLQVLLCTRAFYALFDRMQGEAKEGDKQKQKAQGVLGPAPLVRATAAFLREFLRGQGGGCRRFWVVDTPKAKGKARAERRLAFIPTVVYDALKGKKRFDGMRGGHQEDAEEFLGFFLDTLEEELLKREANANAPPPVVEEREEAETAEDGWLEVGRKNRTIESTDSPITRIFGGKFRSTLRAPGQRDSVIDALALISQPSTIQITPSTTLLFVLATRTNTNTRTRVSASQQVLIEALPPVLVLHLKRFCYSADQGGVVKVGKQIAFGPELEVPVDVIEQGVRYRLFGVIYHHGVVGVGRALYVGCLASGGTSSAAPLLRRRRHHHPDRMRALLAGSRGGGEGSWVRIDDELVSDVRPATCLGLRLRL